MENLNYKNLNLNLKLKFKNLHHKTFLNMDNNWNIKMRPYDLASQPVDTHNIL